MTLNDEQKIFLKEMFIKESEFIKLNRDAQILIEIANDYELHKNDLLDEASYIANKMQRCSGVHSVRSRVKDTSHLIEKIIRKWSEESVSPKYHEISKDNYKSTITDLIGVRAIYLFKSDWKIVHDHILSKWEPMEEVIIYYREGDDLLLYAENKNCKKEVHFSGYRSIHYIIPATKINGEQICCEVQTRTIFEEGWSEIDHKVRYPSFSKDPYLKEYLNIFNRISGSADEMGSFVNSLRELVENQTLLEESKKQIIEKNEIEIQELQCTIEKLFKDKAELEEIQKAYNKLKLAQENKEKIAGKTLSFSSAEDFKMEMERINKTVSQIVIDGNFNLRNK
ncbi:hypothetical protein ABFP33_12965 [Acinetobacter bereziniae]|uniref:RelA/SpoT domain-containing protein n=1 Tax=Acinetobacter bereziniae TaxID=106648 RepID=UPI0032121CEA